MKEKDRKILEELRKNGRASLTNISAETNIPVSTVFDRVQKLEQKIITRYATLIDPKYFRYSLRSIFITRKVPDSKNINSVFALSVPNTYAISAYFRDIQEYKAFRRHAKIIKEFPLQEVLGEEMVLS